MLSEVQWTVIMWRTLISLTQNSQIVITLHSGSANNTFKDSDGNQVIVDLDYDPNDLEEISFDVHTILYCLTRLQQS